MILLMEIIGWVGAAMVLGAYLLVSAKRLAPDGLRYQALNVGGAFLLGVYALWHGAVAGAVLNGIWFIIGMAVAVRAVLGRRSKSNV